MVEWFLGLDGFTQAAIILGALDIIIGSLPDKYSKGYPGAVLAVANKLFLFGKESKDGQTG